MKRFPFRWVVIVLGLAALVGLGYWGVKAMSGGDEGKTVMATKPVGRGDIEVTVRGWGELRAKEEQQVVSSAMGVVKDIYFQPGDIVEKGQILATIDPGSLSLEVLKLEITVESERIKLASAFGVSPDKVGDVDPTTALTVRSPIDGTVRNLSVSAGADVSGTICSVVDDAKLLLRLEIPELPFRQVSVGTQATFVSQRFEGRHPGVVTKIDSTPIKGSEAYYYAVWVEMKNPGLFRVGDQGTITLHLDGDEHYQPCSITSFGAEEAVNASVRGRVKEVFVRDGQEVKAGDPVIQFEAGTALLDAMALQVGFKEKLVDLEEKKAMMNNLSIVCPMSGVATDLGISVGQPVGKGGYVTRIYNYDTMNLMLRVDEMDVPKVKEGQPAQVLVWGSTGQEMVPATVDRIGAMGDPRDGLASFNITLNVENPGFLRPGMYGEALIYVSEKEDVLLCPVEALYKEDGNWFVDIKAAEGQVTSVQVSIGLMNDTYAEILEGLNEGAVVVVGMTKQADGMYPGGVRVIY